MRTTYPKSEIRIARTAAVLAAALFLGCATAGAIPQVVFLVEDDTGVPILSGGSTDPRSPGWIEAIALGTGFEKLPSGSGHSARRARLVVPDAFVITRKIDKASLQLQLSLLKGEVLPVVKVKFLTDARGPEGEPIMIVLRQVSVVDYDVGNGSDDPAFDDARPGGVPTELISLRFNEISWVYRYEDPAGGEMEELSEWDVSYGTNSRDEDSDGDGIPNVLDPDDDNDGFDDEAELAAFMNPLFDDLLFDFDGDDDLNIDELIRGTDPNSGHSFFGIDSLSLRDDPNGMAVTVRVPILGGRIYRVMGTFNLGDPDSWIVLGEFRVPPGAPAEMGEFELPAGAMVLSERLFLRVTAEMDGGPR